LILTCEWMLCPLSPLSAVYERLLSEIQARPNILHVQFSSTDPPFPPPSLRFPLTKAIYIEDPFFILLNPRTFLCSEPIRTGASMAVPSFLNPLLWTASFPSSSRSFWMHRLQPPFDAALKSCLDLAGASSSMGRMFRPSPPPSQTSSGVRPSLRCSHESFRPGTLEKHSAARPCLRQWLFADSGFSFFPSILSFLPFSVRASEPITPRCSSVCELLQQSSTHSDRASKQFLRSKSR